MNIEKERQTGSKLINRNPPLDTVLDIPQTIGQGKRELLDRRRPRLADVITADRNGIKLGCFFGAEWVRKSFAWNADR